MVAPLIGENRHLFVLFLNSALLHLKIVSFIREIDLVSVSIRPKKKHVVLLHLSP